MDKSRWPFWRPELPDRIEEKHEKLVKYDVHCASHIRPIQIIPQTHMMYTVHHTYVQYRSFHKHTSDIIKFTYDYSVLSPDFTIL